VRPDPLAALSESGLDTIREACAWVAGRSVQVRIDDTRLREYADSLPIAEITAPVIDPALESLPRDPELRAAFVCTLDAVNFGSGYFPLLRKRPGHSGYRTIEAALRERFAGGHALRAEQLATIQAPQVAELFGQSLEGGVGELMERFAAAWNQLGTHVQARAGGSFLAFAHGFRGSAEALALDLAQLPSYADVASYGGRAIPFLKRAQITAADLAIGLPDRVPHDLDRLTLFADNLVPHVLRMDGVLHHDPALLARIDREELLESGSPEEVEIRACGVDAVERVCARVRERGAKLDPWQLDRWLWLRGGAAHYKAQPRHRARSWFY
jgi:hypothetical protein